MSLLTQLIRLIPPSFKPNYCPKTWQQLANDVISGTQATFLVQAGNFLYNYGSTTPSPENRIYPWLNTPTGRWYTFQFGLWVSPHPIAPNSYLRQLWTGTNDGTPATGIWAYDEGNGVSPLVVAPTQTTGPFWQVDSTFDARMPIGPGTTAGGTVITTDGQNPATSSGGSDQHTLTDAEGATGTHQHPFGLTNPGNDDAFFRKNGAAATVPGYTGYYITGSNGNIETGQTTADLVTLPPGTDGKGVTPTAFSILNPYRGAFIIGRTNRIFYTLAA